MGVMEPIHYHIKFGDFVSRGSMDFLEAKYLSDLYAKLKITADLMPCLDDWSCPRLLDQDSRVTIEGWVFHSIEEFYSLAQ